MGKISANRKRKNVDGADYENAPEILSFSDEVLFDADGGELEIEEEMVIAVMKTLEEEISSSPSSSLSSRVPISFEIDEISSLRRCSIGGESEEICSPTSRSSSGTPFVTPRSDESCGSLFSDSAWTVMASVDEGTGAMAARTVACLVGVGKDGVPAAEVWPWAVETVGSVGTTTEEVEEEEAEEEWLERVLGWPLMEWEWEEAGSG